MALLDYTVAGVISGLVATISSLLNYLSYLKTMSSKLLQYISNITTSSIYYVLTYSEVLLYTRIGIIGK